MKYSSDSRFRFSTRRLRGPQLDGVWICSCIAGSACYAFSIRLLRQLTSWGTLRKKSPGSQVLSPSASFLVGEDGTNLLTGVQHSLYGLAHCFLATLFVHVSFNPLNLPKYEAILAGPPSLRDPARESLKPCAELMPWVPQGSHVQQA